MVRMRENDAGPFFYPATAVTGMVERGGLKSNAYMGYPLKGKTSCTKLL